MPLERVWEVNNIEQELKEKLVENSDEFLMLQELVKSGKYTWEEIERIVEIKDGWLVWKWKLDIEWTNVEKVKAKKIRRSLNAENVKSLKEIEIEEIWWSLDIRWTSIEFQLKVIKKIRKWKLKVNWEVYFWWDVEWIEKLVENENLVIPWSLDISWTNIKKIKVKKIVWYLSAENVESLEEIEVEEIWWGLNISWTSVKKIKAKIIEWYLNAENVKSLEEIEVEKILWKLNIEWTRVKKIKAKTIKNLDVKNVKSLEEIEVEVIWWDLNISWTSVKKIKAKRIGRSLYAEWVKSLKEIEVKEGIEWNLDIEWTSIEFQLKVIRKIRKIRKWKLKVKWSLYYDKSKIYIILTKDWELKDIFEEESDFYKRYGKKYKEIQDEWLKKEVEEILNWVMKRKYQKIVDEIVKYANNQNEEKIKELSEEWEKWKIGYKEFMGKDFRIIGQCFKNKK